MNERHSFKTTSYYCTRNFSKGCGVDLFHYIKWHTEMVTKINFLSRLLSVYLFIEPIVLSYCSNPEIHKPSLLNVTPFITFLFICHRMPLRIGAYCFHIAWLLLSSSKFCWSVTRYCQSAGSCCDFVFERLVAHAHCFHVVVQMWSVQLLEARLQSISK